MVQPLEAIKGGGGSIKIGSRGTISSLVTRELESMKVGPELPLSATSRDKKIPISVNCGTATAIRLQPRKFMDKSTSSSQSSNQVNMRTSETSMKTKACVRSRNTHKMPILGSDDIHLDRAMSREKMVRKGIHIVEIVDIKCGNPNSAWSKNPITNRLRKLGFSKLSETVV